MKVKIFPSEVSGKIKAPASKSMAHRLLICASLCEGESVVDNIAYSQDILATLDCLEALGAKVQKAETYVKIRGINPFSFPGGDFNCRESGSTLRFFIPIAMLSGKKCCFRGSTRLMERPMEIYENLAKQQGISYIKDSEGISISGSLSGGDFSLRGDVSSQFVTGLLFALALCKNDSRITLTDKAESLSYIDMTIQAQKLFGVDVIKENDNTYFIKGSQSYKTQHLIVEGDYSNVAFLEAFNYLGGNVKVTGLDKESLQGDKIYGEYFRKLKEGCPSLDISQCPDLAPILMSLACELNGAELTGTHRLKIKESDRGEVMKKELSKFGADIEIYENKIVINKTRLSSPLEHLSGHNDHRIVMALTVLASKYSGVIEGAESVSKSYPDFFERVRELGVEVKHYGD